MNTKRKLTVLSFHCILTVLLGSACSEKEEVKPDPTGAVHATSDAAVTSDAGATSDSSSDAGPDAAADAPPDKPQGWACPKDASGAKMVLIPTSDGNAYCIDERQAVYAEYKRFVDAKGQDTSGQPAGCEWNDSFLPTLDEAPSGIPDCYTNDWLIDSEPNRAANCMDFCDAWAFCSWSGKRLCGVRGADPKKPTRLEGEEVEKVGTSVESEWFNVCSQGATTKYPYGDTYEAGICIDDAKVQTEGNEARQVADTSDSACHGLKSPYSEVYNMSGDVRQWLNICRESGCAIQGGPWYEEPNRLSCDESLGVVARISKNFARGIRCCADAVPASR